MRILKYREAIAEALVQIMEKDKSVFIMGEGVDDITGIFGTTLPASQKFPNRVMDMPLSEALITGAGTGAALVGMKPVMVHARNDFLYLTLDQIANHAAIWSEMHGGGINIPWVIRSIIGRGWGNAAQHSQSLQAIFAHIPGIKVVMPSTPYAAKGLLIASINDPSPVMFLEHRSLFEIEGPVPEEYYSLPLGQAAVLKTGKDLTMVAISFMSQEALKAGFILEQNGINAEVIDVSSLKPLDENTIFKSVKKTGRVIVLDTAWKSFGASAELSARISENLFCFLKAPVKRIALPDSPTPCSYALEKSYYPGVNEIVCAVFSLMGRENSQQKEKSDKESAHSQFQGPL